jgi:phage tail sheath protein FI
MPEYLAPGVYVEETSFRAKTIEGVSTSTAGFVGPARYGPVDCVPELLTSYADFERIYGGLDQLELSKKKTHNFLAHAVRAFFEEGGKRLYVSRVCSDKAGKAKISIKDTGGEKLVDLTARFPGAAGNMRVTFMAGLGGNLLYTDQVDGKKKKVRRIQDKDTVALVKYNAKHEITKIDVFDVKTEDGAHVLFAQPNKRVEIKDIDPATQEVRMLSVDVHVEKPVTDPKRPDGAFSAPEAFEGFSCHPEHTKCLTKYFTETPASRTEHLTVPFAMALGTNSNIDSGPEMATALLGKNFTKKWKDDNDVTAKLPVKYDLANGSDGDLPDADAYKGENTATVKTGLAAFEDIEDISIVAAPGYSHGYANNTASVEQIQAYLISHCERMRYRIAVLDSPDKQAVSEIRNFRGKIDSKHAALYYPWVKVLDPVTRQVITLPPSGFVAGIYARNDVEHGVHKAPANEVVRIAIGFERDLNKAHQDVLNPEGINCFRFFEGRGYRLWGARTISSDPEWKYVNLRRYFAFLERSIEKGTQWIVFRNNSEVLWANVRRTVEDFLFNEWKSAHLMGEKPQQAYFVRCDRSTMTQNDIDNGRLICLVGVAPVRPAEFVIFRIGQWTADRRG